LQGDGSADLDCVASPSWTTWLWPHSGLEHVYRRQCAAFLLLLIASTAVYLKFGSVVPFLLSSVLAPIVGVVIYRHGARRAGPRGRLQAPIWQRSSVLLVLVCMVVIPSAALFRLALSHEFAKLVVTERDWVDTQADDMLRAASVEASDERYAGRRIAQLEAARRRYLACVPAPFDAGRERPANGRPPVQRPEVAQTGTAGSSPDARTAPAVALVPCPPPVAPAPRLAMLQPMGMGILAIEALRWFDDMLPVENDTLARQHFHEYEQTYSPDGTILPWFRASGIAFVGFLMTLALLAWWIKWSSNHLFLADLDASGVNPPGTWQELWEQRSEAEQNVLMQVSQERIANPHQRPIVKSLLHAGLLRLDPDLQLFDAGFHKFVREQAVQRRTELQAWEQVNARRSWRYGRIILAASVAGVGFFLIATQPGLQSSVMAIATGITGVLTAGSKLRDALTSWIDSRKSG